MEMNQKQLELVKEALTFYRSEIDRAMQPEYANEFLLSLTAPFIEIKRQEIENLSTLVDISCWKKILKKGDKLWN